MLQAKSSDDEHFDHSSSKVAKSSSMSLRPLPKRARAMKQEAVNAVHLAQDVIRQLTCVLFVPTPEEQHNVLVTLTHCENMVKLAALPRMRRVRKVIREYSIHLHLFMWATRVWQCR